MKHITPTNVYNNTEFKSSSKLISLRNLREREKRTKNIHIILIKISLFGHEFLTKIVNLKTCTDFKKIYKVILNNY